MPTEKPIALAIERANESVQSGKPSSFVRELLSQLVEYNGYTQILFIGAQGSGKTAVQLWNNFLVYGDWRLALDRLYVDLSPFLADLRRALETKVVLPCAAFDDAGKMFSKYVFAEDPTKAKNLNYMWNMIRTGLRINMLSSPDDDILFEMRRKTWITARVSTLDLHTRQVEYFTHYVSAYDMRSKHRTLRGEGGLKHVELLDPFAIPKWVWEEYTERRRLYFLQVVDDVMGDSSPATKDKDKDKKDTRRTAEMHDEVMSLKAQGMTTDEVAMATRVPKQEISEQVRIHSLLLTNLSVCPLCADPYRYRRYPPL